MTLQLTRSQSGYNSQPKSLNRSISHKNIIEKLYKDLDPTSDDIKFYFPTLFSNETLKELEKKGIFVKKKKKEKKKSKNNNFFKNKKKQSTNKKRCS